MKLFAQNLKIDKYLIICGIYIYCLYLIPVLLYRVKYLFNFSDLLLYCLSSFVEISFVLITFYILFNSLKNIKILKYIFCLSFLLLSTVYFIQGITFCIIGDFLPVIAIENVHEYKYHFGNLNSKILILSLFFIFINIRLLLSFRNIKINKKVNIKVFITFLLCFCLLFFPNIRKHSPATSFK